MAKTKSGSKAGSGPKLEDHQVVLRPLVTEKGTHQFNRYNAYPFEVNPYADKQRIKQAVEELFDVRVLKVRTQNRRGKPRHDRFRRERKTKQWKKAIVMLHAEDRIEFF